MGVGWSYHLRRGPGPASTPPHQAVASTTPCLPPPNTTPGSSNAATGALRSAALSANTWAGRASPRPWVSECRSPIGPKRSPSLATTLDEPRKGPAPRKCRQNATTTSRAPRPVFIWRRYRETAHGTPLSAPFSDTPSKECGVAPAGCRRHNGSAVARTPFSPGFMAEPGRCLPIP